MPEKAENPHRNHKWSAVLRMQHPGETDITLITLHSEYHPPEVTMMNFTRSGFSA